MVTASEGEGPLRVPRTLQTALTPDEAIVGGGFTMLEAGLMGPVIGIPGAEYLAPFPEVRPPVRKLEPEPRPGRMDEEGQTALDYFTGQEMPAPSAGGGIVGMASTIPLTPASDVFIPAGSSQVISDFLDISGSVNVEIGAGGVLEIG